MVSTRRHKVENLVEGRVCSNCNHGWMSSLEGEAKPLLIPLMDGEKEIVELEPNERLWVARWAFKTAIVLNSASNFHNNVPPDHFNYFYANQDSLPPSVIVVGQQDHDGETKFYWLQRPFVLTSEQAGDVSLDEAKKLVDDGMGADLCGTRLTPDGKIRKTTLTNRVISIDLKDIHKVAETCAVGAGGEKALSIIAGWKGGLI